MEQSVEEIHHIFNVNVFSQMYMTQEFYQDLMEDSESHIVSMASSAAVTGSVNLSSYCASKFAVNGFMDAFNYELRATGKDTRLLTTVVYPFVINTGLTKKPFSRFSILIPFTEPDRAVQIILDGMRRNEKQIFIPRSLECLLAIRHVLPIALQFKLAEFLGCGVERHEEDSCAENGSSQSG